MVKTQDSYAWRGDQLPGDISAVLKTGMEMKTAIPHLCRFISPAFPPFNTIILPSHRYPNLSLSLSLAHSPPLPMKL